MNKPFALVLTIGATVMAYLLLVVMAPVFVQVCDVSAAGMEASANMSNQPGVVEAVNSFPYWMFALPGAVCIVVCAVILRKGDRG